MTKTAPLLRDFYGIPPERGPDLKGNFENFIEVLESDRRKGLQVLIVIDSRRARLGKSTLGLRICRRLDPGFQLDQVVYSAMELQVAFERLGSGSMILYDEAVLGMLSKKGARDVELSGLISTLTISGKGGVGAVLLVQKIQMLDTIVRNGIAPYWLFVENRGRARLHRAHRGAHYRNSQKTLPYSLWDEISPIGWRSLDREAFFRAYNERAKRRNMEWYIEQQRILQVRQARAMGDRVPPRAIGPEFPAPEERPRCPKCGRQFARQDILQRHLRTRCAGDSAPNSPIAPKPPDPPAAAAV